MGRDGFSIVCVQVTGNERLQSSILHRRSRKTFLKAFPANNNDSRHKKTTYRIWWCESVPFLFPVRSFEYVKWEICCRYADWRNGGYNKNHHRMEQPWTSKSIRNFIWTIRSISCWFFVYLFLVFTLPSVRFVRLLDCLLFFHLFLQVFSDSPVLVLIVSVFVIPLCGNYEKDSCNSFCALAFF